VKIIIWGFPLHTHTHSYIHAAWYKFFRYLGYETYWFDENNYPADFDYKNCLFITEGFADKNIPLEPSSTYFVHICINPKKYLSKECRVIDIRFNVDHINDTNYSYVLNRKNLQKIDSVSFYDSAANDQVLADQWKKGISNYEALYFSWATDMLPTEFNFDDINIPRENKIYWVGTIGQNNQNEMKSFVHSLNKHNIQFLHNDPWSNPISSDHAKLLVQKSFIAPDIRGGFDNRIVNGKPSTGSDHKSIGYIPCRIFKNISYGQLGICNSKAVYDLFDGNVIYSNDEKQLIELSLEHRKNIKMILNQMLFVKENHTYINRINSILKVYNKNL